MYQYSMHEINPPLDDNEFGAIALLMREYHAWCLDRYPNSRRWEVEKYFNEKEWNHELASLKNLYIPPVAELYLLRVNSSECGCVALKQINSHICELKRLYVKSQFRGNGYGRMLAEHAIQKAKEYGYKLIRLEFGNQFVESQSLYKKLGFYQIKAYTDISKELVPYMIFMELKI